MYLQLEKAIEKKHMRIEFRLLDTIINIFSFHQYDWRYYMGKDWEGFDFIRFHAQYDNYEKRKLPWLRWDIYFTVVLLGLGLRVIIQK